MSTSISQNFLPPGSLIALVKVPHPDPIPPERILNKSDTPKSTINGSFAFVKDPTPLAERIPYISPVASLLEALPTQNASVRLLLQRSFILLIHLQESKLHQERWDPVNNKLGKVTQLVNDVVTTCANNNLEENDLPRSLHTIFQSLESYAVHS